MIPEENIIFIGGVPRSGTSLVQKILDNHTKVYGGPEFDHLLQICQLYDNMSEGLRNKRQSFYYSKDTLKSATKQFIYNTLVNNIEDKGVSYLSEKTPMNVLVFERLKDLFPKSKFVLVIRDPRAVLHSLQNVYKKAQKYDDPISLGSNTFKDLKFIYSYLKEGENFYKNNPNDCSVIYYEKLINNPENVVKKLCSELNLSFENNMLDTNRKNDSSKLMGTKTTRAWYDQKQYDRTIDKSSLYAWEKGLKKKDIILTNLFFQKNKLELLFNYEFKTLSFFEKTYIAPEIIKEKGIIKSLKSSISLLNAPKS
jgi:hypothetical protein